MDQCIQMCHEAHVGRWEVISEENHYSFTHIPVPSKHRRYLRHISSFGISQACWAVVWPFSCYEMPPACWWAVQGCAAVEADKARGRHRWWRLCCGMTRSPKQAPLKSTLPQSTARTAFSPSSRNSIYPGFSSSQAKKMLETGTYSGSHIFIAFSHAWSWHKCLILQPLHSLNTLMVYAESSSRMGPCGIADFCAIDISSETWEMLIASFAVFPWWPY